MEGWSKGKFAEVGKLAKGRGKKHTKTSRPGFTHGCGMGTSEHKKTACVTSCVTNPKVRVRIISRSKVEV